MSQNSLDVPPISFARYLELLKRRRWQVLPASVGGLVIGFFVAFLIPRYYVTDAKVRYTGVVYDEDARTDDDEMAQLVAIADQEMPRHVEATMAQLGIIGAEAATPLEEDDRRRKIDSYKERLETVVDLGKNRQYPLITVVFRDTDGNNCKQFADEITRTWLDAQLETLSAENAKQLDVETQKVQDKQNYKDSVINEINALTAGTGLDPQSVLNGAALVGLEREIRRAERELDEVKEQIAEAEAAAIIARENLNNTPPVIKVKAAEADIDPELKTLIAVATKELERRERAAANLTPGTPAHVSAQRGVTQGKQRVQELMTAALPQGEEELTKDNPRYQELQAIDRVAQANLEKLRKLAAIKEAAIARQQERLLELSRISRELERLLEEREEADEDLRLQQEKRREIERKGDQIRTRSLFQFVAAQIPPTPTDPNIVVVALTGSLVGLLAAIGLVLLIDLVRSTFKTVDDVEYSLTVPVLGSMSHIETTDERRAQVRSRTKVVLLSGAFLALVVAVLSIYFVAPTRLPTTVVDLLDTMVGSSE